MDINEIAKRAGVSRATVSRYLNDGYVSAAKRDAIARVIAETGYVPSRQARQLRTGKTGLVAVIIPKINSQSVSRMVAGITDVLATSDYQLLLGNTDNDEARELDYLRIVNERRNVDGVILIATVITSEHRAAIDALAVPLVVLGQRLRGRSCVYHDDYHAVRELTASVLSTCRVPAYLGVREDDVAVGAMRHKGFLDACVAAGIPVASEAQAVGDFTVDSGYLCCERVMDGVANVDTIVCATDDIAYGALTCLREYGHAVPNEVQVVGVGDSELSRIIMPSLTSAHLFYKSSGMEAARMLLGIMDGDDAAPREVRMGYEVYARTSTRKMAGR